MIEFQPMTYIGWHPICDNMPDDRLRNNARKNDGTGINENHYDQEYCSNYCPET